MFFENVIYNMAAIVSKPQVTDAWIDLYVKMTSCPSNSSSLNI